MNKLYARTKADLLDWEPTEDPNIFAVKIADYTVSILRAPEAERYPEEFAINIANSDGLVIQEISSFLAAKIGFSDMNVLFDRARHHALDIDGALDDLIGELDDLSDEKS